MFRLKGQAPMPEFLKVSRRNRILIVGCVVIFGIAVGFYWWKAPMTVQDLRRIYMRSSN
jgi:hypothetical protein